MSRASQLRAIIALAGLSLGALIAQPSLGAEPITLSYPYLTAREAKVSGVRGVVERASQSYVHVIILYPGNPLADDDPPGTLQQASGVIVDGEGHVVTNAHIARTTKNTARVVARDGSEHAAQVVFIDPDHDLALLRIKPFRGMRPARFGDARTLKRGQALIAVGSPSRGRGTVSVGFVRIPRVDERIPYNRWNIVNAVEIAMEVESGHSGGPVFDRKGTLVGIVAGYELGDTTKRPYVSPRITYAIPADEVRAFLARAKRR